MLPFPSIFLWLRPSEEIADAIVIIACRNFDSANFACFATIKVIEYEPIIGIGSTATDVATDIRVVVVQSRKVAFRARSIGSLVARFGSGSFVFLAWRCF